MEDFVATIRARIMMHEPLGNAGFVVDMAARDLLATFAWFEAFHAN